DRVARRALVAAAVSAHGERHCVAPDLLLRRARVEDHFPRLLRKVSLLEELDAAAASGQPLDLCRFLVAPCQQKRRALFLREGRESAAEEIIFGSLEETSAHDRRVPDAV